MKNEDVIRMAREAGFKFGTSWYGGVSMLERFAALVAAHTLEGNYDEMIEIVRKDEREACAKVCDDEIKSYMSKQYTTDSLGGYRERFAAEQCAAAIRARGEK